MQRHSSLNRENLITKGRFIGLTMVAIIGSLGLHLFFLQASTILFNINIIFGKVVAICGLNGIYVTEKPFILWVIYPIYIMILIISGTVFTWFAKGIIEHLLFDKNDESKCIECNKKH